MSGGGTTSSTSSSQPPAAVLAAYQNATNQAQNVSQTPFQNPVAPVAPLSQGENAGISDVNDAQGASYPYIGAANNYIAASNQPLDAGQSYENTASQGYANVLNNNPAVYTAPYYNQAQGLYGASTSGITPSGVAAPQQFSAGALSQYESPYTSDVVNATQAEFNNQNAQQQAGVQGNAISAGAWGGDRSAVAQGITAGQEALAQAPVIAGLENTGYQTALGEFNTQQQTGLNAQEYNIGTGLQAQEAQAGLEQSAASGIAGLGTSTAAIQEQEDQNQLAAAAGQLNVGQQALGAQEAQGWLASQGAYAESALGTTLQNNELSDANAELGIGSLQQGQNQAELNSPYENELAQLAYPFQTSQFLTNSVEGLGSGQGGTSSTTQPGPSTTSQIAGLGTAGLGAAALFGLLSRGGGIHYRAGGGGLPTGAPGIGNGIAGVVNIVPQTAGSSVQGMGPPKPPQAQVQPDSLAQFGQTMIGASNVLRNQGAGGHSGGSGAPSDAGQMGSPNLTMGSGPNNDLMTGNTGIAGMFGGDPGGGFVDAGTMGDARGGEIPHRAFGGMHMPSIPHGPKLPGAGGIAGIGGHSFHPPGLPKFAPGGGISYAADPTSQEIAQQNAGQDEANAMAVAMAANGSATTPMMMPQTAARGGGIAHRDDGGAMDDNFQAAESNASPGGIAGHGPMDLTPPPAQQPDMIPPPPAPPGQGAHGGVHHSAPKGGGDMIDPPPEPPGEASPVTITGSPSAAGVAGGSPAVQTSVTPSTGGGITGGSSSGSKAPSNHEIWGATLLAAGLGMLGGSSPFAAVNIGRGGLQGLQFGEQLKNREENVNLRQAQQENTKAQQQATSQYHQDMVGVAQQRADTGQDRAQTYAMVSQASAAQKQAQAAMETARASVSAASHATEGDIRNSAISDLMKQPNPDTGNNYTRAEAFRYTGGFDIKQQHENNQAAGTAARVAQGDARIGIASGGLDLRQQAFQAAGSRHDQDLVEKSTDADLARAVSLVNGSKDINGQATKTLHQALGDIHTEKQSMMGPAATAQAPAAAPQAPTAPGTKPSLDSILGE